MSPLRSCRRHCPSAQSKLHLCAVLQKMRRLCNPFGRSLLLTSLLWLAVRLRKRPKRRSRPSHLNQQSRVENQLLVQASVHGT